MSIHVQLSTGTMWDLTNPDPDRIYMKDVCSLAGVYRYINHARRPVSVLRHLVLCCHLASPKVKPYALVHDVEEAFIGDIPTPVKELLVYYGGPMADRALQIAALTHSAAVWKAFGLMEPTPKMHGRIRDVDLLALATEKYYCMVHSEVPWHPSIEKIEPRISAATENIIVNMSETEIVGRFRQLCDTLCLITPKWSPTTA